MSFTSSLFQNVAGAPVLPLVGAVLCLAVLSALGMFFKPLLSGLLKAAVLVVRPRRTKDELAARRQMRDIQNMKKMINSAHGVTQTAELHCFASRG